MGQPGPPCMAHARSQSKKQNQRGVFMRQQSAPDLPPEHTHDNETDVYSEGFQTNSGEFRSRSQGNLRRPPPMSRMHSIDADVGYKSEGNSSRYNQGSNSGEIFPYNQALPPNSMPPFHQRTIPAPHGSSAVCTLPVTLIPRIWRIWRRSWRLRQRGWWIQVLQVQQVL